MPTTSPTPDPVAQASGRLSALRRWHPTDRDAIAEAQAELKAVTLEAAVRRALSTAPPLSDTQRGALAALLVGDGSRVAGGPR